MTTRSKRRYGDDDRHFGPFTLSGSWMNSWRPIGVVLNSGGRDERNDGCHLLLHALGWTLICEMPQLIKPWKRWIDCSRHEWAKNDPNAGYWDKHECRYGFTVSDGFLQVFHGAHTFDSDTDKTWCAHLPWTQWRHIRFSLYGLNDEHFWTQYDRDRKQGYGEQLEAKDKCPKKKFLFKDYDGQSLVATTFVEESEWRFGEGWFKWLSLFRRPKVRRYLRIEFSDEVGPEKGSWKGGTMGHSIDMLPGELHEDAFRRYCEQEHRSKYRPFQIEYVGTAEAA